MEKYMFKGDSSPHSSRGLSRREYVRHLFKKETRNTSKTCHRCGYVTQVKGRIFECPNCGMEYDRDLNACINIAHRVMSSVGWGSCEPREPVEEAGGVKPQLNAGSPYFSRGRLTCFWYNLYRRCWRWLRVSYPPLKRGGLPASTTRLDPHSPRAQVSFVEAVSANHVWEVGYGGLGLHRRNFGLPHA